MAVLNENWYNAQSTRRSPLDDLATGTTDAGIQILDDILVDCQLRWPADAGLFAYLSALTVTDKLVTAVLMGAPGLDAITGFVPLAAVSLPKPVRSYVFYPITPLHPGVGGFVVFGDLSEPFSGRFSTPRQGLLMHKVAQPYHKAPVTAIGKLGVHNKLTGLITLQSGPDISITYETPVIRGKQRQALVFRLAASTLTRNLLSLYTGPCGKRPESRSCDGEGIETINGVGPDCAGNINIKFVGILAREFENCGNESIGAGVTLDTAIGVSDVCNKPSTQTVVGQDLCAPVDLFLSSVSMSMGAGPEGPGPSEGGDPIPGSDAFEPEPAGWTVRSGTFDDTSSEPGTGIYLATDLSRLNITTLSGTGPPINRTVATSVYFPAVGVNHNGGIIANYRVPPETGYAVYFAIFLDREQNELRVLRFTGLGFVEEASTVLGLPLSLENWYRITATFTAAGEHVAIDAEVVGLTDPTWPTATVSLVTNRYGATTGAFGIGADRSETAFGDFSVT